MVQEVRQAQGDRAGLYHKDKGFENYEPPKLEVLEIMVEQAILQMSGMGSDSDDSEFGLYDPRGLNW